MVTLSSMASPHAMHVDYTFNLLCPPIDTFGKGAQTVRSYSCFILTIPSTNCSFFLRQCTLSSQLRYRSCKEDELTSNEDIERSNDLT